MAVEFNTLKIFDVRRETPEAVSIAFTVPRELTDAYRFQPGQYLTLRTQLNSKEIRRSYSICTAPEDGELRVVVKKVHGGLFSTLANDVIKVGDELEVMTPQGRFGVGVDNACARDYVAIAAGSGITPILSIAHAVLARDASSTLVLIYGNRTTESIIFREALEELKDRYLDRLTVHHLLSREVREVDLLNGRIDSSKITALLATLPNIDDVYLCGPGELIELGTASVLSLGIPAERVHAEYFSVDGTPVKSRSPSEDEPSTGQSAIADIVLNGTRKTVFVRSDENIVAAGVRAGLEMPFSCRAGMCCTCRAKLLEGDIRMDSNYSLEKWEMDAGYVLACQAHPTSSKVVLDFDQV